MTINATRRISDRVVPLVITGYFMPTSAPNMPVLIAMPGTDDLFIFAFSTEEKLASMMTSIGIEYARVAIVIDGSVLLDDIKAANDRDDRPHRLRLAVDPYKADNDRVRFIEPLSTCQSDDDLGLS